MLTSAPPPPNRSIFEFRRIKSTTYTSREGSLPFLPERGESLFASAIHEFEGYKFTARGFWDAIDTLYGSLANLQTLHINPLSMNRDFEEIHETGKVVHPLPLLWLLTRRKTIH